MQRLLMDRLTEWKDDLKRKPLLINGIGKCGKTYLLKDFATKFFKNMLYYNLKENKHIADLFGQTIEPMQLIKNLSIISEKDITPGETLIIFDDIQESDRILESLRFFSDGAAGYHIAAAASFLDVALKRGTSLPAGSVELLTLYPMNFYEFLLAQSPMLALHLKESAFRGEPYNTFERQLTEKFAEYQIIGGMPEVVQAWLETKSIETVDRLQTQIIKGFESDFMEFAPNAMLPKLITIWNAIPAQLVKGNRKFMFSKLKKSWRAKDLDDAVHWLIRAGLVYKTEHVDKPGIPLSGSANSTHFKLYMCDTGLLRRTGLFPSSVILSSSDDYKQIKSCMAENIVCCELKKLYEQELYYWSAEHPGRAEVDFIIQDGEFIIPIEVKAGKAGRARSLKQYQIKFKPKKSVLTGADTNKDDVLPLFAFWNLKEWLKLN